MASLNIVGLTCVRTTAEARDEPYLTAVWGNPEGSRIVPTTLATIWGPREMNDGDSLPVNRSIPEFAGFIEIELLERDRIGRDEHIDSFRYHVGEPYPRRRRIYPNEGEMKYTLIGDRAKYEMIYDLRDPGASPDSGRCQLILRSLRCNDAQEAKDEPYLVVNGERVWAAEKVKTGETRSIEGPEGRVIPFGLYAQIDLWESDGARSDRLGEFTVDFASFRPGEEPRDLQHVFRADPGIVGDASYTLTYCVRRLR